ncbi:MAG TPA: hypothetical protein VHF91_03335, partial [Acidimicrobiales bacterium]|nr:hypothetical protein [Acidimicrobiales bacterium]
MGDHGQFSDDISDLWGPSDTGVLEPAPLRKPEPEPANGLTNGATASNGAVHEAPPAVDQRLAALERDVRALAEKVGRDHTEPITRGDLDALRTDLEVNLGQEVVQARRDLLAQLD